MWNGSPCSDFTPWYIQYKVNVQFRNWMNGYVVCVQVVTRDKGIRWLVIWNFIKLEYFFMKNWLYCNCKVDLEINLRHTLLETVVLVAPWLFVKISLMFSVHFWRLIYLQLDCLELQGICVAVEISPEITLNLNIFHGNSLLLFIVSPKQKQVGWSFPKCCHKVEMILHFYKKLF